MSRKAPDDRVENVEVDHPDTGNLPAWAYGGSLWVHSNFVTRVLPKINTRLLPPFQLPKGNS